MVAVTENLHKGAAAMVEALATGAALRCPHYPTSPAAEAWYVGAALVERSKHLPSEFAPASACSAFTGRGARVRVVGADRKTTRLFLVKWAKDGSATVHEVAS